MDDIKETVRNAGDSLCRAVSSLTIRLCDVSLTNASDAKETMNIVLPYLLSEGILSKVSSVQKASISLVMKLAKVLSRVKVILVMFRCIYLYQLDAESDAIEVQW
jgi:proteasome component ECM29